MRHEQDGNALGAQLVHSPHAALAEVVVAHRKSLVDQQDFRLHADRYRESQPHEHSAGVGLDGPVDKVADLGEGLDLGQPDSHVPNRQSVQGGAQTGVLPARELRMESRAELEQGCDPALDLQAPGSRTQDPRRQLEGSALSGPVRSDQAKRLARTDFE